MTGNNKRPNKRIRSYNANSHQSSIGRRRSVDPASLFGDPNAGNNGSQRDSKMEATRRHTAGMADAGMSNISMSTGRPRDPMFYWKQNHLPFDFTKQSELRKLREFCNTPDAPIWMGDYSFKPIGEVRVGDEVMGWEWIITPSGKRRKKLVRTRVVATNLRVAPEVVRVEMESGRIVRCTPDHKWANPRFSPGRDKTKKPSQYWNDTEYMPARVGMNLIHVIDPTEELSSDKETLAATWLAGLYDGEGYGAAFAQKQEYNPAVYERIQRSLDTLGIRHNDKDNAVTVSLPRGDGHSHGGFKQTFVDLLNHMEPARKVTAKNDQLILTTSFGIDDKIVSITSEGEGEVVSMQTETGNYVVWGYASSNCRLLYMTHPVISACIDIYSKLPLQGLHVECKDPDLVEFYEDLFINQLKYEDHLTKMGRQYWLAGEVFTIGAWNETLGVWEDEQIINPDDVEVETSLFVDKPRFMMRLPETLRNILNERSPVHVFEQLAREYPELLKYTGEDDFMPVSNYIMHHMFFEADDYSNRGISILMRAWRTIIQEEMLMTALDAIADRLYTPFIIAKLGASATDLGTNSPWVPTEAMKQEFAGAMDAALAGDFRVLITHFATEVESLFGRENVPDLSMDFDRITERILMAFGLSQTMLTGASAGETYAADALNRDVVTQLLTHYQRKLQQFFHDRAMIVAEAQGHFDYEIRNNERYLLTEEIYEIDEESGEEVIKEIPKLLVPELKFKILNLTDEQAQQEFVESLAAAGVPIPIRERIKSMNIPLEDMIEVKKQETVDLAIAEQEARREIYLSLKRQGLPVPLDLLNDFSPKATQAGVAAPPQGAADIAIGQLGTGGPQDLPVLSPNEDDLAQDQSAEGDQMLNDQVNEQTDPMAQLPQEGDDVPSESNEQRERMPKKSVNLKKIAREVGRRQVRQAARKHYREPDNSAEKNKSHYQPTGKFGPPHHIGMRYYMDIPEGLIYREGDE